MAKPVFGEPAPNFVAAANNNPQFHFDTIAGRNIMLVFLGAPLSPQARALVGEVEDCRDSFDDRLASMFFVVSDPAHIAALGLQARKSGIRYFMDYDRSVAALYGFCESPPSGGDIRSLPVECGVVSMDRHMRVLQTSTLTQPRPIIGPGLEMFRRLDRTERSNPNLQFAPVLVVERVFEPSFCRRLIDYYRAGTPQDSGFMREKDGYTVGIVDHGFKRRQDVYIQDEELMRAGMNRVYRRLLPEIRKAFQFEVTRIERHIVACYDADIGGFFRCHRDNTTKGTAHRRFALSINLNSEEFEGGEVRFPEFGSRSYRAPTGGAVVFSCSLLHEALPVTRGIRYVYLPFLYNDDDARVRQENKRFLDRRSGGLADVQAPLEARQMPAARPDQRLQPAAH